jgi:hypothetical protein
MQVLKQIYESEYGIPISQDVFKKVVVSRRQIEQSLGILTLRVGNNTLIDDIKSHIECSSSPNSFSSSWNLRSRILTKDVANRLVYRNIVEEDDNGPDSNESPSCQDDNRPRPGSCRDDLDRDKGPVVDAGSGDEGSGDGGEDNGSVDF